MFTLDGQLLGIVAECEQKLIVVAAESVAELLRQPPSMETRLEDCYGIKVSDETMPTGARLGNAVQIVSIWTRSRGEEAGLRPGDVITAADGQPVVTSGDLEAVLTGGTSEHQFTIQRGRQSLVIALPATSLPPSAPASYGMTLDQGSSNRRVTILAVAANSSAQHAGILGGDVLLQVGTMPVTDTASARRALQDAKATRVLTLEREGRQYEVLIKP
jgi:S1-C subfamily serine protease